ncbi:MAG: T9SS type A sorting domain-containing protein [Bacteroidetes bacterium]|nr:T9SS type A sorting domain-containing protein [Bacteroidota bacterium]
MRRSLLLSILSLLLAGAASAQAPVVNMVDFNAMGCEGGSSYFVYSYSGTVTSWVWEESSDGATSWHIIPNNTPPYRSSLGYLAIDNTPLSMNHYLYRVTLYNGGAASNTSRAMGLLVAQTAPGTPTFVNPATDVCVGESVVFTIQGGLAGDSIYWNIPSTYGLEDTVAGIHFPNTGPQNISATAANGCGSASTTPISVTVHPVQATTSGDACNNLYTEAGTTTTFSDASCNPMLGILPSGTKPVFGTIQSCVTVDGSVQSFNGVPYVPRHYSLVPALTDPTQSTATVTLYFTQGDFDAYNLARGSNPALPTGSSDAAGKANLKITQFHGTGTTPDTYVGGSGDIDPDDNNIVWNSTASRWEVTFDIVGFSGFFVSSGSLVPLPVTLADFSGVVTPAGNELHWATAMEENTAYFEVQKAGADGVFKDLAKVAAAGDSHQLLQYSYVDAATGAASYRLQMVDIDGKTTYSRVVALGGASVLGVRVSPNPSHQPQSLVVSSPSVGSAVLTVTDMGGRKLLVQKLSLQKGDNFLNPSVLGVLPQGIYMIGVATDRQQQTIKFIRE